MQHYLWPCGWLESQAGVPPWNTIRVKYFSHISEVSLRKSQLIKFHNLLNQLGYKLEEFVDIVLVLNAGLHRKPSDSVKHVRNKYSHKLFHEVATVPLKSNEELLEGTTALALYKRDTVINFYQAL